MTHGVFNYVFIKTGVYLFSEFLSPGIQNNTLDRWMEGCMEGWIEGCMEGFMEGCVDLWICGWKRGRMDACKNNMKRGMDGGISCMGSYDALEILTCVHLCES